MQPGVVFPQNEIGADPGAVRAYATAVEELGYQHIVAYEHVFGVDREAHPGWHGLYEVDDPFHEPLVLFGFLAAITSLELVTGVLVLPQRQTGLVAKQAAQVDILAAGRFRLGVGIGWNSVEFAALGRDFSDRGARITAQIELMRSLWTRRSVEISGYGGTPICHVGISPPPCQRPIPVWLGAGNSRAALRRVGTVADGWFPLAGPGAELEKAIEVVREAATGAGRAPSSIGMEGMIDFRSVGLAQLESHTAAWRTAGATHLSVDTMRAGLRSVDEHLDLLASIAPVLVDDHPAADQSPSRLPS